MATRNELLQNSSAALGGFSATYTGGIFLMGANVSLSSGASFAICMETGSDQIILESPIVNSNSGDLTFEAFEDSSYTGGTNVDVFLNDRNSVLTAIIVGLVKDPVITDDGTRIMPIIQNIGDNNTGKTQSFSIGYPLILKPNTKHILRVTHNDGQARQVNFYASAFRRRDI